MVINLYTHRMNKPKNDNSYRLIPVILYEMQGVGGTFVKYKQGKRIWEEFVPFKREYDDTDDIGADKN